MDRVMAAHGHRSRQREPQVSRRARGAQGGQRVTVQGQLPLPRVQRLTQPDHERWTRRHLGEWGGEQWGAVELDRVDVDQRHRSEPGAEKASHQEHPARHGTNADNEG